MFIRTSRARRAEALSDALLKMPEIIEFRISPTGD
jgi:hypothetical protein